MLRAYTTLTALLLTASARAGIKVERVPIDPNGDAAYAASAHDLSAADLVEAFKQQTGIDVFVEANNTNTGGGPAVVYDLDFSGLTRPAAIKELARVLGMGVNRSGQGPVRLSPNSWSGEPEQHDTPGVAIASITRIQSMPPSPAQPDGLNVQLRVFGGRRPIDGAVTIDLAEGRDSDGRPITLATGNGRSFNDAGPEQYSTDTTVRLEAARTIKSIALLRGTATLMRAKTMLRVTVDAFADTAMEDDFGGATISVGPLADGRDGPALPIVFTRGKMDPDRWMVLRRRVNRLNQDVVLRGPKGEALQFNTRQWTGGADVLSVKAVVTRPDGPNAGQRGKDVPRPVSLKWDSVGETVGEPIDFEFKDVAVP